MMKETSPPPPPPPQPAQVIEVSGKHLVSLFLPSIDGYLVAQKCEQVLQGAVVATDFIQHMRIVYQYNSTVHKA